MDLLALGFGLLMFGVAAVSVLSHFERKKQEDTIAILEKRLDCAERRLDKIQDN